MKTTPQQAFWKSGFGDGYLKRNLFTPSQLDREYRKSFGITRRAMNGKFIGSLPKQMRILEVGANFGMQLKLLSAMGFVNLYGVELNPAMVALGRRKHPDINLIEGDALDLPFKDGYFDLVFTSGVLIHIAPKDRAKAMKEIYRCSRRYIWGFEYFAESSQEIPYHGHKGVLWKADFAALYQKQSPSLRLVKEERFAYRDSDNEDAMFLLKK
jgi:pseudaminic acid biosynthesis-associated methylase